jgi:TolB protein
VKLDRFDGVVWGVLGLIGLMVAGLWLIGDRVGARIVRTLPPAGSAISAKGRLAIEFAQAMDETSVENGFSLQPPVKGRFIWQDKTMTFLPLEPYRRGGAYTAQLAAGVLSADGQAVKQVVRWQFTIRPPAVIYLGPSSDRRELWSIVPGGPPAALTSTNGAIYDYAVSPDGERVAYSLATPQGGLDLWIMNRDGSDQRALAVCAADRCSAPSWAPDGGRLAYSREGPGASAGGPHGPPRVWIFDLAANQASPLYADSHILGYGPSWSPDGKHLAAWDGSAGSIRVLDLQTQQTMLLPSQSGTPGAWSPDGAAMLFNDISLVGEQPYVKMFLAEFATKTIRPAFSDDKQFTDYNVAVWSPDGQWVAAGLKTPDGGQGSHLWILHPDGTGGRAVADDPQYTYGSYHWDPWSQALIFQRFALGAPLAKPEILLWSAADNSVTAISPDGSLPEWLP